MIYIKPNYSVMVHRKYNLSLTLYILYITPSGICLNYKDFCEARNIHAGITEYILYISNGIALDYNQFNSNIHAGITEYILYISNGIALDYNQFNSKIHAGITEYILYISNGIALDYNQFNSNIHRGLMVYVFYGVVGGVALDYQQFQSKIYVGIVPSSARFVCEHMSMFTHETYIYYITPNGYGLDYQLFKDKINAGLTVYVLYVITPSEGSGRGICVDYQQFKTKIYAGIIIYIFDRGAVTPASSLHRIVCLVSLYDYTFISLNKVDTSLAQGLCVRSTLQPSSTISNSSLTSADIVSHLHTHSTSSPLLTSDVNHKASADMVSGDKLTGNYDDYDHDRVGDVE
jgi:hypothetical protein